MLPSQTECVRDWSTHGEAVYTGASRQSCCVLLCICCLTESVNELVNFNTGWSSLGRWNTPGLFLLPPCQLASPCWSCCVPGQCYCCLEDPEVGAGAGAPHCATCHSQSRSGSLKRGVGKDMRYQKTQAIKGIVGRSRKYLLPCWELDKTDTILISVH